MVIPDLIPDRLRGDIASFDLKDKKGKTIVDAGRRITAVRACLRKQASSALIPSEYLISRTLAEHRENSGEVLAECNAEVTAEILDKVAASDVKVIDTIYTNELDCGPYISDTLRIDGTRSRLEALVEIYRMMRPGEPPTKEAAENLFNNLFFSSERYDLSDVGRMKFNRRLGRKDSKGWCAVQ